MCSPITYACKGVFNPNIPIFASNSAEGLYFSAFHLQMALLLCFFFYFFFLSCGVAVLYARDSSCVHRTWYVSHLLYMCVQSTVRYNSIDESAASQARYAHAFTRTHTLYCVQANIFTPIIAINYIS